MANVAQRSGSLMLLACRTLLTFAGIAAGFAITGGDGRAGGRDLPQDYVSARALLDGSDPYLPLATLYERYGFPPAEADVMVVYNPHPPVAIMLTLPFALAHFPLAVQLLIISQILALALTWTLSYELFRPNASGWIWAAAGGAFGFWSPVWQGLAWGQPVGLLALALLGIWWLGRSERGLGFGILLAATILVRPFAAILAVLACSWPRRLQLRAAIGFLVGISIPFSVLQIWPWEWYRVASYASGYITSCGSIPGIANIGVGGGMICFALGIGILALMKWYGLAVDPTAALSLTTSMLLYPLAWFQYDTCLIPTIAWVLAQIVRTGDRIALWSLAVYLALRAIPDLMPRDHGEGLAEALARHKNSIQVLARAILLVSVAAVARRQGSEPNEPTGAS